MLLSQWAFLLCGTWAIGPLAHLEQGTSTRKYIIKHGFEKKASAQAQDALVSESTPLRRKARAGDHALLQLAINLSVGIHDVPTTVHMKRPSGGYNDNDPLYRENIRGGDEPKTEEVREVSSESPPFWALLFFLFTFAGGVACLFAVSCFCCQPLGFSQSQKLEDVHQRYGGPASPPRPAADALCEASRRLLRDANDRGMLDANSAGPRMRGGHPGGDFGGPVGMGGGAPGNHGGWSGGPASGASPAAPGPLRPSQPWEDQYMATPVAHPCGGYTPSRGPPPANTPMPHSQWLSPQSGQPPSSGRALHGGLPFVVPTGTSTEATTTVHQHGGHHHSPQHGPTGTSTEAGQLVPEQQDSSALRSQSGPQQQQQRSPWRNLQEGG